VTDAFAVIADVGLPMLAVTLPGMLLTLLPVIMIESFVFRAAFGGMPEAFGTIAAANLFSTLIGVPLAWISLLVVQFGLALGFMATESIIPWERLLSQPGPKAELLMVLIAPAWLGGSEKEGYWLIPAATLILLAPYWYASYRSELWLVQRMLGKRGTVVPNLRQLMLRANLLSYAALGAGVLVWLGWALAHPPVR
jgi:hypothetical protein